MVDGAGASRSGSNSEESVSKVETLALAMTHIKNLKAEE